MNRIAWLVNRAGAFPVIGMLHAPPLPGAPAFSGSIDTAVSAVLRDAETLVEGGVPALMLENFGDAPFARGRVNAATVASLTRLAAEVRRRFDVPFGINVLRNDGRSALAIASATGAAFVRVNVLCGARVTDQGVIEGIAHELLRDRRRLGTDGVRILADVDVKHSAPLAPRPIAEETRELVERGGADAVIVSGRSTGDEIDLEHLQIVRDAAGNAPVLAGSGVTADNLAAYARFADAAIVGTWLKRDGQVTNPVDPDRVRTLMSAAAR